MRYEAIVALCRQRYTLQPLEAECLALLCNGPLRNHEIAAQLKTSSHIVATTVWKVKHKGVAVETVERRHQVSPTFRAELLEWAFCGGK